MVVAPIAARAQKPTKVPKVGVLWHAGSAEEEGTYFKAVVQGFKSLGYKDGENIVLEHRFADEKYERFDAQAAELAQLNVDVILAVTPPAALAAQQTSREIRGEIAKLRLEGMSCLKFE